jgi:hypothetical protein
MWRHFVLADYKPAYYWWDCLEMLRKAILTGILVIRVCLSRLLPALFLVPLLANFARHFSPTWNISVHHRCSSREAR